MCEEAMGALRDTNKFLTESEPWKMKGDDKALDRQRVRACLFYNCTYVYIYIYIYIHAESG
jgi:methionyl-tRNA synthetase